MMTLGRPTFHEDVTSAEREIFAEHVEYLEEQFAAGRIVFAGPSSESKFAIVVLETETGDAATDWQEEFGLQDRTLVPTGRNPYFIREPGFELVFASEDEKLVITVLDDTIDIGGVTTRVVEEREWKDGALCEVSRNLFAICKDTRDAFYFGEDVDDYKNGAIVGHGGAWRADEPGTKPGLIMPGRPKVGMKYYQEIAPGVAMDRAEVINLNADFKTPAGCFQGCS